MCCVCAKGPKLDTRHLKEFPVVPINDSVAFPTHWFYRLAAVVSCRVLSHKQGYIKNTSGQTIKRSQRYRNYKSSLLFSEQKVFG